MRTADLSFDELNKLLYQYDYADRLMNKLLERSAEAFANCRMLASTTFYSPKKTVTYAKKMYGELWADCKKTLLRIGKHYNSDIDDTWLWLFLTDYDPLFKVVYENEQDRKRARFVEGVLASDRASDKRDFIDRSMRIWIRMIRNMGIEVTDRAMIDKYKADGVTKVMWVAEMDNRTCMECYERHGKIYPIDKIPDKPHINCRCRLLPVR